ncbi:MAG: hypothetical protein ICV53_02235 [Flavisolibacter sp.]|nr:hypothetical protein [Flavisolibacter sp.]
MKLLYLLLWLLGITNIHAQAIEKHTLYSQYTKRHYNVAIKKPEGFDLHSHYILLFVPDGALGLGRHLLDSDIKMGKAIVPPNCIVIALQQTGRERTDRNRDFIPSDIRKNSRKNFGRAHCFYRFMKDEWIPYVDSLLPKPNQKILLGHSLSGLVCLYAALQEEPLFDQYFAISPSVWANHFELLKIEKAYARQHNDLKRTIHIFAGSKEVFDLIRYSTHRFVKAVTGRKYPSLALDYTIIKGKDHFTVRKPVVDRILQGLTQ